MKIEPAGDFPEKPAEFVRYHGYYDRTIFYSPVNKFCILSIRTDDKSVPEPCRSNQNYRDHEIRFTVTGYDLPRVPSVEILWEGDWQISKYGPRLQITQWDEIVPLTREGILNYLSSGLIKGIGPRTAEAIVDRFGLNTLDIFENHPDELLVIRGITKERLEEMKRSYAESRALRNLMTFLAPFQITPKAAQSIYQYFGTKSIEILRNNPYELCHVPGFGFLRVDSIVQKNSGKLTAPSRIKAAILFVLEDNKLKGGHLYVERDPLLEEAFDLLNRNIPFPELRVGRNSIDQQFQELLIQGDIIATRSCIYLKKSFELENETARCVAQILTEHPDHKNVAAALSTVKKRIGIALSEKQEAAVFAAFQHNLSIITGGPGTGKTTVLRAILEVYQMMYPASVILLAAPTGRASRRMAESTGYDGARTLHSALRLGVEDCTLEEEERATLNVGLIIVDETSMVDMWLAKQLFSRIAPGTKVILVGDADQLPSVGAGNVFRELIDCGEIPVTVLDQIFRQAETSRIVYNSKYINEAKTNLLYGDDFVFVKTRNQHDAAAAVCDTYYQLITEFGIDRVMILAPFRNEGEASANSLNAVIREHLNPCDPTKKEVKGNNKETFRVGDRVMQTKNLHDIELFDADGAAAGIGVFNGDIGTIRAIDETSVTVDFDGRYASYSLDQLGNLTLAYAITVHKAMGSECDGAIIPVLRANSILLNRNLIYTAITRAKKKVYLIGQRDMLYAAILRQKIDRRNTLLGDRVKQYYRALSKKRHADAPGEWEKAV